MARPKSTTGGKTTRTRANSKPSEEQVVGTGGEAGPVDAKASATTAPETVAEQNASAPKAGTESPAVAAFQSEPDTKSASEPRKLGVVKTEPRKHAVVPFNLEDEIRRRAYEIYQQRGNAPGSEAEDWLAAEREVRQRYQEQSA